ncbi:MAG: undecaprenyl/decaprenyl-phosphate alpha-N-acetylglucosaminyl 1-phosphate transferase [Candidatus Hydrogenedentota bacterium]|uniref:Undecaprenyl-phosphate N-acetylglucosaminyl 1-phosphate transferase n=1 Tax=Sumerlaea chitinivorans TaxID=2250252 RepID=A0A2Z4Y3G9_SUMC1|nr:Undecaprenyl-phosphate N-acetylglucosaminyl 1-phosphate transferase [Candidatus Sumerlaea chitinivorans]RMH29408.1 MAG: undecaprenyl/decaprenyl-phosphate alpha-N-acetylglucosaminyl 1-phosphate transferase [Candidatus Hydrogenedentota bacterium]GIX44476.1 MAG: undecaprenyl-phosphate alpha-N-acetylglucosaminyl 1-phosphate transferase [Candidatus Sumerlaea sp.]
MATVSVNLFWKIFVFTAAIAFVGTWVVRAVMRRMGVYDAPSESRKIHREPVAYEGGVAIYVAFVAGLLFYQALEGTSLFFRDDIKAMILGATLTVALGVADDLLDLRPVIKLLGQIGIGYVMYRAGFQVERISNPFGQEIQFWPWVSMIGTILWYAILMNGINMIDGLDGLAAGIVAITCITLGAISVDLGQPLAAVLALIGAAACFGFLPFNFNPATIFMGDAGSLLLGFLLASITLLSSSKAPALLTLLIPVLAVALPLFETLFAFVRRILRGQNPFAGDRSHLHHRFLDLGFSVRRTVLIFYYFTAYLGVTAYVLQRLDSRSTILVAILIAIGLLLLANSMGYLRDKSAAR